MSTYTDTKNRIKETVNVAYHPGYPDDRVSIQKVKFLNEENEYWGTFKGRSILEDSIISGSTIYDTILKDVTLSGRILTPGGIDINAVGQEIENIKQDIENILIKNRLQDTATEQLDKKVDNLSVDLIKLLSIANNGIELVKDYVDEQISAVNDKINTDISTVNDNISSLNDLLSDKIILTKTELSNALTTEKTERIADFAILSTYAKLLSNNVELSTSELINKIDRDRHYEILSIDNNSYPYKLKDFAVNNLLLNIPQGKVIYDGKTIGSITRNDENGSINFTVYTLSDPYLYEALTEGYTYTLGTETVPCKAGYLLKYDSVNDKINIISTIKKHLNVVDTNTEKANYVGKVTTFNPDSDTTVNDIESGNLTIYPTSDSNYNEFLCLDKAFNKTDLSCIKINNDQIIYTGNNRLVLRKNVSNINYCKIIKETDISDNIEIGRIYNGNVVYDENNEIVSLKASIDNFNYEISKPNLYSSVDTLFGELLKDHGKLAVYNKLTNNIKIYDNILYAYELKAADDICVFKPGKSNIHLYNYNEYDVISAEIHFGNIPNKHLDFVLSSEDKKVWTSNTQYVNLSIELTATFDAAINKLLTIITKVGDHGTETVNSTYIFDVNNNTPEAVEKLDSYETEVTSKPIDFIYDNIVDVADSTFEATINQQVIIPDNVKTFLLVIEDDNINTIDIEIPAKDENLKFGNKVRAREFIFTTDLTPTNLNRYIEVKTNYDITNGVENTLSIHLDGLKHTYKFVEIEENKFLYVDLNNHNLSAKIEKLENSLYDEIINNEKFDTEISTKLETLSTEVSSISSYTLDTIDELSTNVYEEIELLNISLSNTIDNISEHIYNKIELLSTDLSGEIELLSTNLSNEIILLSTDLSSLIELLSTDLSTTVSSEIFNVSSYLYNEINVNLLNIQILSTDLLTVSADLHNNISVTEDLSIHYNNTLSGIDRLHDTADDIKSDNLIITDPVVKHDGHDSYHDKYYLTFLSGTLVLKKIER